MTLGELIIAYRTEHGLSQRQFSARCGLSNGYISMIEKNINPKTGEAITPSLPVYAAIAKGMGITVQELFLKIDDVPITINDEIVPSNIFPISRKKVPLLGEIACGEPIFTSEDRESYVEAGTDIKADFCLKAKGDSMINARIFDGDIIFCREQPIVENGQIAAVIIGDEATLKRVYYEPDKQKLVLQAENPKYPPLVYVGEELNHIRIIGLAIAFQSDVI